eukprot:TRINITY_DN14107_c0_g1_i1.p1 TRINITY_DN14107_c0_g1~~TRINITY_DN14107_c0_g1_i1.p1  ORF type:complete len:481 (-),score=114.84 TRINITY_DN14107_c0_g1_i1:185-1627(-)
MCIRDSINAEYGDSPKDTMEAPLLDDTDFDAIVVGTGLTECIVAGAISRAGHKVLHLDHRQYYGGSRATVALSELVQMAEEGCGGYTDWRVVNNGDEPGIAEMMTKSRQFQLDLAPAVLFSKGPMVEALARSGVSRYTDFQVVHSTNVLVGEAMRQVPCSKNEIFADKGMSLLEKRTLMRFLQLCLQHVAEPEGMYKDAEGATFMEFLQQHKLSADLKDVICYAIACTPTNQTAAPVTVQEGAAAVIDYLKSVGRFNSTAFLCTQYGVGELPQAFCRLSAVYHGTYILGRGVQQFCEADGRCTGVVCTAGQQLNAKAVIADPEYLTLYQQPTGRKVARAICVQTKPWIGDGSVAVLTVPPTQAHPHPIFMLQTNQASGACPNDYFVLSIVTTGVNEDAALDLQPTVSSLSDGDPLWAVYYSQQLLECGQMPEGLHACDAPNSTLLIEDSIAAAQAIFEQVYPGEEFLPQMPDPEEDDDDI